MLNHLAGSQELCIFQRIFVQAFFIRYKKNFRLKYGPECNGKNSPDPEASRAVLCREQSAVGGYDGGRCSSEDERELET